MYDASRGTFRVACLLFVFLQGAWSCLFWNMNLKGTPRSISATEEDVLKALRMAQFKSVQYSFHSETAISLLKKMEVKHV